MKLFVTAIGVATLFVFTMNPAMSAEVQNAEGTPGVSGESDSHIAVSSNSDSPLLSERRGFLLSLVPTVASATLPPLFWAVALGGNADIPDAAIAISIGVMAAGLAAGPSLGHFYAKRIGYGFIGVGGRLLDYGGAFGLFVLGANCTIPSDEEDSRSCSIPGGVAFAGSFILGAGMLAWGIYDIATTKRAVRRENSRRQKRSLLAFPSVIQTMSGNRVPALGMVATF